MSEASRDLWVGGEWIWLSTSPVVSTLPGSNTSYEQYLEPIRWLKEDTKMKPSSTLDLPCHLFEVHPF